MSTCCFFGYRTEGGIPPLVRLLESNDAKVQRAAAGALRTLAFKNEANKNQVFLLQYSESSFSQKKLIDICEIGFLMSGVQFPIEILSNFHCFDAQHIIGKSRMYFQKLIFFPRTISVVYDTIPGDLIVRVVF